MRTELEQKFANRWPTWFDFAADFRTSAMGRGFEHGDGWFDLVWRLCEELEPLVAEYEKATGSRFEVVQVKEKFGGLRFYAHGTNDAIRQRIKAAELESTKTCELCGSPGQLFESPWLGVRCDECVQES